MGECPHEFLKKVDFGPRNNKSERGNVILDSVSCGHQEFLANVNSRSRSLYAVARPSVVCL